MRRIRSDSVQFVTWSDTRLAFGTITSAPSNVRTVLERMPIRFTSPVSVPSCTESPTWIGRSKSRMSPDTKLFTTFWSPKPTPTPSAPAMIVMRVRSIPSAPSPIMNPSSRIA
jgi:hypothetical protein